MTDVLLFPSEPNPEDVTLREGGVAGPVTYTVNVSVTAAGLTAVATSFIPAGEPEPPPTPTRGGGYVRPVPVPVTRNVTVVTRAHGQVNVSLAVDHAGRRHLEDELLLVGAI
jgi:hypothetical protein